MENTKGRKKYKKMKNTKKPKEYKKWKALQN